MRFIETPLPGAYIIELALLEDERGFFAEVWKDTEAIKYGIDAVFNRSNLSFNRHAGTIRGMHAQREPHTEAKLVRCVRGAIFDVVVDIRPGSETFGQWTGDELTAENRRLMYVPRGFLHGFQTLADDTEVFYEVAGRYAPAAEFGARYDDPAFSIAWPLTPASPILSPKDASWPLWGETSNLPPEMQPRH